MSKTFRAVLWDFGGVITGSPLLAFRRYERENGLPEGIIGKINTANPDANAWAQLERSEISEEAFDEAFAREADALGYQIRGREVLRLLAGAVRPEMVAALKTCKTEGYIIACITNNHRPMEQMKQMEKADSHPRQKEVAEALALFDRVFESSLLGMRKPDPQIYHYACRAIGLAPREAVYLDDLGVNLKPARALGMHTIKVGEPAAALAELSAALGVKF